MPQPTYYEPMDANLESRIRGLVLGLAVGDAVGSRASDVPEEGELQAGAASQLAAWTIESLLRNATRYGGWHPNPPAAEAAFHAYRQWVKLRGPAHESGTTSGESLGDRDPFSGKSWRGWLIDHPAMGRRRGSSPSTEQAMATGRPQQSAGCQAMLRILATAPMALARRNYFGDEVIDPGRAREAARRWAREVALLTHDDGDQQGVAALAVDVLAEALLATDDLKWAIKRATYDSEHTAKVDVLGALKSGFDRPCVPEELERLAPDKTSWSAIAGGIYVAMSFPDEDTIMEALEFAGWAPDGDSVAAVAGAILGARHGYEALPTTWVSRLELGWVLERLAIDLAAEVHEHQGGKAWKDDTLDDGPRPADPWWDTKYPGVWQGHGGTGPVAQDLPTNLAVPTADVVMPNDGSWLAIDTSTGYTFSEYAVMVPEPPGELFDVMMDGDEERANYAAEHGRQMLMPGSPGGTPLTDLEEWDEPPWLIDPVNGDSTWEPWHLVIVPRPDDEADLQALYSDDDFASRYAGQYGVVPVAPFKLHRS